MYKKIALTVAALAAALGLVKFVGSRKNDAEN